MKLILFIFFVLVFLFSKAQKDTSSTKKDMKPYLNFWVLVQTDVIYDINKMDPEWTSYFRPSKIPIKPGDPGYYETDGQLFFSVKPSTFKFEGVLPLKHKWEKLKLRFEFDLVGLGPYGNQTGLRFRLVYADWGPFRIGKDWSTFIDLSNFPNIYDWWGPSGMALLPAVTFRYTHRLSKKNLLELAIEMPGSGIDNGDIRHDNPILDPVLEKYDFKTKEQIPDFIMRYTFSSNWGHFKLMTLFRYLEYEYPSIVNQEYISSGLFGWAINTSLNLKALKGNIRLQSVFGNGYAGYNNDGGVEIAPVIADDLSTPNIIEYKATVPFQYGLTAFYDYNIRKNWSGSLGYSETTYDNTDGQSDNAFHKSQYVVIQTVYTILKDKFKIGLNYQYGRKYEKDGANAFDQRVLLNFTYMFSKVR
jgi:hypothetical protein